MATIFLALVASVYMVLSPAHWLKKLMELTQMSWDYELFLMGLGIVYLALAWAFERHLAPALARFLDQAKERVTGRAKRRKGYKLIRERMRSG